MDSIQITQSVAILCDGNNIERSIHEASGSTQTMVNFDELVPKLLNGRGLNRLIYFREGKSMQWKNNLNEKQISKLEANFSEAMKKFNYK